MTKQEKFKAKMVKKTLENKMLPSKQVRTTTENKRLKARKELADRVAVHKEIDTAKAEGREIGFKPGPIIQKFKPFSKQQQTGKKK